MKIRRSAKISLLLAFLTLLMPIIAFVSTVGNVKAIDNSSSYAKICVSPPNYMVTVLGDIFTVDIKITNVSDLKGFEFKLGFNTAILNCLEVVEGAFLEDFGTTLSPKLEIDEAQGLVWVAIVILGSDTEVKGNGTLATINFESTGTGECVFDLYDTVLGNSEAVGIDHYVTDGYSIDEFVDPPKTLSEAEIHEAIISGIQWLVARQNPDGSWGWSDQVAMTGFAVLKLETHAIQEAIDPLNPSYLYYDLVRSGLDYIFSKALMTTIGIQPAGDPDSDSDGVGICFSSNGTWHRTYETSIAMMAIAANNHPEMVIDLPGSIVDGWTYGEVMQDAVDYLAFGQNDAGNARGGWGYYDNSADSSDNSVTGYAVLGLAYAETEFGCTIPSFVRNELSVWIDYIQNDVDGDTDDGGSGYTDPYSWVNILKTGNLLFEMAFVGDTWDTQRVVDAVHYIERHWNDANSDPGWKGDWVAHKQAMYTTMKGLESLGIETIIVDSTVVDWFEEIAGVLVEQQKFDGSWDYDPWGDDILGTEWALLTLQKTVPFPPPGIHDVAVTNVVPSETLVKQGDTPSIGVTVENHGNFSETFDVTVYYDGGCGGGGVITPGQWDIFWSMGDTNVDGYIDYTDAQILFANFGWSGPPGANPADINSDGEVNILDAIILSNNLGLDIWTYFGVEPPPPSVGTQTVTDLMPDSFVTLIFTWDTTDVDIGSYTLCGYATPVMGEFDEEDNCFVDDVVTICPAHEITFEQSGVGSDFAGTVLNVDGISYTVNDLPVIFSWREGTIHTFAFQSPLIATPDVTKYLWSFTTGLSTLQEETITVSASGSIVGNYETQYYLEVVSPYDTPGGEGWYNKGEIAYAVMTVGLEYEDGIAYGFVGWGGDASGWDLISDSIIMDAPKTANATWNASEAYGDVRTIGFWKHQVNVWYFTELNNTVMKIRGIGTAQISEELLLGYLTFIDSNSDYFNGRIVKDNDASGNISNLEILENGYNILRTPRGADSLKMRAEQQLLALWLNLAHEALFWNTQLSQETQYIYCQHNYEDEWGLTTIGEAIRWAEAQLFDPDGNYEVVKDVCDSINNNLGIIWGT